MTSLHMSMTVNVVLVILVAAFCVKYDVMRKIARRFTEGGGVIDPVSTDRWNFACDVFGNVPASTTSATAFP